MTKVLVIGGSGFIGSHLVEHLCLKGYNVSILVRKNSDRSIIKPLVSSLVSGDILDRNSLCKAFQGMEIIFFAANARPSTKADYERIVNKIHSEGTENILKACHLNKIKRLVYFSSVAAMGYEKSRIIYDESFQGKPLDAYGIAKLKAENILREKSKKNKTGITILRPPGVFGERGLGPLRKILLFSEKGILPIIGSGNNRQSITYVGNVVDQAIFLSENNSSIGKTYITTDENSYTVNEIIEKVLEFLERHPIKIHIPLWAVRSAKYISNSLSKPILKRDVFSNENLEAIAKDRVFDGSKIFRDFGYRQKYRFDEGIKRTIEWYKDL